MIDIAASTESDRSVYRRQYLPIAVPLQRCTTQSGTPRNALQAKGIFAWLSPSCNTDAGGCRLQQPEFTQFPAQRLRHDLGSRRSAVEIARNVFDLKITPALKRPPWS